MFAGPKVPMWLFSFFFIQPCMWSMDDVLVTSTGQRRALRVCSTLLVSVWCGKVSVLLSQWRIDGEKTRKRPGVSGCAKGAGCGGPLQLRCSQHFKLRRRRVQHAIFLVITTSTCGCLSKFKRQTVRYRVSDRSIVSYYSIICLPYNTYSSSYLLAYSFTYRCESGS
jgi:hypothetical protein